MDLHEYLRLLRRRWKLLVACVLVAGIAAFITTPAEPVNDNITYSASHTLLRDTTFAQSALATVALFVKTGDVPGRAAERLGYEGNPAVLAGRIALDPNEQVGTLDITATGGSADEAAERANVFAEETLAVLGEQARETQQDQLQRVNEQLATLQADLDAVDAQLEAVPEEETDGTLEAQRDSKLRQYGAALDQQQQILNQPPPSAGYVSLQEALPELAEVESGGFSAPRGRPARTALAAVVGLILGLGAILLIERLDTRLHDAQTTAEAFGLPVIAEVPMAPRGSDKRILTDIDPMSAMAEAYRTLRSSVLLSPLTLLGLSRRGQRTEDPQVLLVTSPAPGDGKTTSVANLAAAMAEAGRSVLVLGCDFRRPEIHAFFEVPASPGIADVLTGERGIRLEDIIQTTAVPGVSIAPSGSKLRSFGDVAAAGRQLVEHARTLADIVLIDTAPLLATNDASELIPACDGVIIVSRMGKTTADGARRTRFLLERLGAPVAGVVAVAVPDQDTNYSSYYVSAAPVEGRRINPFPKRGIDSDELSDRIGQFRGTGGPPATRPTALPDLTAPAGPAPVEPEPEPERHPTVVPESIAEPADENLPFDETDDEDLPFGEDEGLFGDPFGLRGIDDDQNQADEDVEEVVVERPNGRPKRKRVAAEPDSPWPDLWR